MAVVQRKLRVAHVFLTLNIGGMEKVGSDLIENLDPERFENYILCLKEIGAFGEQLKNKGLRVDCLNKREGFSLSTIVQLMQYFRANKIDVVHTNNSAPHFWAGIAATLCGIRPRIHTNHGRNFDWSGRRKVLDQLSSRLSSRIVCVSQDSADMLIRHDKVNPSKVRVIANGINTDAFAPQGSDRSVRSALGVGDAEVLIGSIARFSTDKDQATLIKAFHQLLPDHGEARLLLVGDGETRAILHKLVRDLSIEDKVVFTGFRSDVVEILRSLDIYVLPSHTEGMSISLLEAMSTQLPVVASRVGGNPEIVTHGVNGLLVEESNVDDMTQNLLDLIENRPLAEKLALAARNTVVENYSFRKMILQYQQLYLGRD